MPRTSKIPESLAAEIRAEWQKQVATGKLRGAYDRIVAIYPDAKDADGKPLKLTKAMVKGIVSPAEAKTAKSKRVAKAVKPKKARKAKAEKSTDSMELFKQLREAEKEVSRIKAELLKILG